LVPDVAMTLGFRSAPTPPPATQYHPAIGLAACPIIKKMGAVERFYQLAVLGLVASGYAGVALTGYLDRATLLFMGTALLARALQIFGIIRFVLPERLVEACALICIIYYPIDYLWLSRDFLLATVHMIIFLAVLKILSARTQRDHFYALSIAFLELLASAILSSGISFFLVLAVFLCCLIAALTTGEIRRAATRPQHIAHTPRIRIAPRLAVLAFAVTAGILTMTAGLFFLLPRTASVALRGLARHNYHLSGFSTQVRLGEVGELQLDSRAIMRVKPYGGAQLPLGLKWRGLTLSRFDGHIWTASYRSRDLNTDNKGVVQVATDEERTRNGPTVLYRVDLSPVDSDALFIAGLPEFLNVGIPRLQQMEGGAYRLGFVPTEAIRYEVSSAISSPFAPGRPLLNQSERMQYLQLPMLDPRIPDLARQMMGDGDNLQRARNLEHHLRRDYTYSLKLPAVQPRDPLADFLFTRRQGHCEYFASSMAVMLRTQGVPSRVVNGFAGNAYNPVSDLYVIRASDAHSWVEAFIDGAGWMTFDPTPSVAPVITPSLMTTIGYYLDAVDTFWQDWVLNYDLARQFVLGATIELGLRDLAWIWRPGTPRVPVVDRQMLTGYIAPGILILFAFIMLATFGRSWAASLRSAWNVRRIHKGRATPGDAAILYEAMLRIMKKRGYQKPPWFTPREFAATVRLGAVDEFTDSYNALRYGGDAAAAERMKRILQELS
jgi:transglutaminase-like putative cysteine protease